jgi:uncharacterized membrane protein
MFSTVCIADKNTCSLKSPSLRLMSRVLILVFVSWKPLSLRLSLCNLLSLCWLLYASTRKLRMLHQPYTLLDMYQKWFSLKPEFCVNKPRNSIHAWSSSIKKRPQVNIFREVIVIYCDKREKWEMVSVKVTEYERQSRRLYVVTSMTSKRKTYVNSKNIWIHKSISECLMTLQVHIKNW